MLLDSLVVAGDTAIACATMLRSQRFTRLKIGEDHTSEQASCPATHHALDAERLSIQAPFRGEILNDLHSVIRQA